MSTLVTFKKTRVLTKVTNTHLLALVILRRVGMSEPLNEAELKKAIEDAIHRFHGYAPRLETAIGAIYVGKALGWEVLYLMHNRSTIKQFDEILGFSLRDQMEANTPLSKKNHVWRWTNKAQAFWKVVRGDIKKQGRTELEALPLKKSKGDED